jgi:hypothetical protein
MFVLVVVMLVWFASAVDSISTTLNGPHNGGIEIPTANCRGSFHIDPVRRSRQEMPPSKTFVTAQSFACMVNSATRMKVQWLHNS